MDVLRIDWNFVRSIFQILVSEVETFRIASLVRGASTIDDVRCVRFSNRFHNHSGAQRLEMVGHGHCGQFCSLHIWHCYNWSFGHSGKNKRLKMIRVN